MIKEYTVSNKYKIECISDNVELKNIVNNIRVSDISVSNFIDVLKVIMYEYADKHHDIILKYQKSVREYSNITYNFNIKDLFLTDIVLCESVNSGSVTPYTFIECMLFYMLHDKVDISSDDELAKQISIYYNKITTIEIEKMIECGIFEEVKK